MSRKAYSMRRRRFWVGVIGRWRLSDLSVRGFCGQEGVSEAAFYSWRKKLACGDSGQETPPSDFLEVTVPAVESAALEVELPCGSVIRVSHCAQIDLLTRLLLALHEANSMLTLPCSVRIFIYTRPTDMRCGFNRLSMLAAGCMGEDPYSGHLFVFFNKRGDKCKILFWDRTGFCLWYKRLEKGTFEKLTCNGGKSAVEVDISGLTLILEGIDLSRVKRRKRYFRKMPQTAL